MVDGTQFNGVKPLEIDKLSVERSQKIIELAVSKPVAEKDNIEVDRGTSLLSAQQLILAWYD